MVAHAMMASIAKHVVDMKVRAAIGLDFSRLLNHPGVPQADREKVKVRLEENGGGIAGGTGGEVGEVIEGQAAPSAEE